MGYIAHDAIIVTAVTFGELVIDKYHSMARAMFGGLVSEIVSSPTNGYKSFFIAPDGSKEGWEESDKYDLHRAQFIKILEGEATVNWVAVRYTEDGVSSSMSYSEYDIEE